MRILVSACLLGVNCKYDGGNNLCPALSALSAKHELIPVCPEVMGGLSTPRTPSEIVNGVVTNREGKNVDSEFHLGAEKALEIALTQKVDLAVLQSRSPSCGTGIIYDGSFSGKKIPGNGVFSSMLQKAGIRVIDVADLDKWQEEK